MDEEPLTAEQILEKYGIRMKDIPKDTDALILISTSPTKGLNVMGTTINNRILATGMLYHTLDDVLKKHWLQQDMVIKQQQMQSAALQDQILNPGRHRN